MSKIKVFFSLNIFQFISYNFFRKNITRDKNCYIVPYRGTIIEFDKTAKIDLHDNLFLNVAKLPHSRAECYLRLKKGAEMVVTGKVRIRYGTTIDIRTNGSFVIGKCNIASGAVITCSKKISIGNNCNIGRNCMIYDSDLHKVVDDSGNVLNYPREVIIGNNVWIGVKSTVLRGAKLKDGSVVGANSLVVGRVKEKILVMNEPAREISKINWIREGFEND